MHPKPQALLGRAAHLARVEPYRAEASALVLVSPSHPGRISDRCRYATSQALRSSPLH